MCPTRTTLHTISPSSPMSINLRSAFDVLDVDHDGKISHDDLHSFYKEFIAPTTLEDDVIGSMMSLADSNKNGFVEYEEFSKVVECGEKHGNGIMEEVFRVMDKDGDGRVGVEDLKSYLRLAGMEIDDEDVMAMVRLGGGNGGVTYQGFLKILEV